jgi:hypothetical protein
MQIDTEWIAVNFDRFNKENFGGRLTPPKFSVNNARTRLGSMAFKWKQSLFKRETYDYVIRLSNYYDIPEVEFQNVLLHEMIHYYIAVNHFKDDSVHGTMFRSIAQRINKQGWHVVVRTDTRKWPVAERNRKKVITRKRIVLAASTTDGKYFLSVIGPGSVRKVKLQIARTPQIREVRWFESSDDYFQQFPQCHTLRGRIVTKELWEEKVVLISSK